MVPSPCLNKAGGNTQPHQLPEGSLLTFHLVLALQGPSATLPHQVGAKGQGPPVSGHDYRMVLAT